MFQYSFPLFVKYVNVLCILIQEYGRYIFTITTPKKYLTENIKIIQLSKQLNKIFIA